MKYLQNFNLYDWQEEEKDYIEIKKEIQENALCEGVLIDIIYLQYKEIQDLKEQIKD